MRADTWQRKPKPVLRQAAFGGDVRVDAKSPKWLQRDEGFDLPQWAADGPPDGVWANTRDMRALVLVESGSIAVGVVKFLRTDWPWCEAGWLMDFARVADEWRRKGVMTRRWLDWRKTYGDFTLSSPLSSAMSSFVGKMNAALDGAFSPTVTFEEA